MLLINLIKDEIEKNGVEKFREVLKNEFGGWPIINQNVDLNVDDLDLLLKFYKVGHSPFFQMDVDANPKNPDSYSLFVKKIKF